MQPSSAAVARAKPEARSRIGNGSALLPTVDGRSVWSRIMRDTRADLIVHCGGADCISKTLDIAVRRVSALEAELIHLENKIAQIRAGGGEPDAATLDLYGRLADRQRRLAEPLGWHRKPRDVTPNLNDYLRTRATEQGEAA